MLEKKVTKLWQVKYTSIRDYELTSAIKKGGLVINHNKEQMILNVDELRLLKPNPKVFQSKFKGMRYCLYIFSKCFKSLINFSLNFIYIVL